MDPLFIDAVINRHQHVALFHVREILHVDRGDIAVDLRADKRRHAAHVGVIGRGRVAGKGRQLPGVHNHQQADQPDGASGEKGNHAQVVFFRRRGGGGALLAHHYSRIMSVKKSSGYGLLCIACFSARRAATRRRISRQKIHSSVEAAIAAVKRQVSL